MNMYESLFPELNELEYEMINGLKDETIEQYITRYETSSKANRKETLHHLETYKCYSPLVHYFRIPYHTHIIHIIYDCSRYPSLKLYKYPCSKNYEVLRTIERIQNNINEEQPKTRKELNILITCGLYFGGLLPEDYNLDYSYPFAFIDGIPLV